MGRCGCGCEVDDSFRQEANPATATQPLSSEVENEGWSYPPVVFLADPPIEISPRARLIAENRNRLLSCLPITARMTARRDPRAEYIESKTGGWTPESLCEQVLRLDPPSRSRVEFERGAVGAGGGRKAAGGGVGSAGLGSCGGVSFPLSNYRKRFRGWVSRGNACLNLGYSDAISDFMYVSYPSTAEAPESLTPRRGEFTSALLPGWRDELDLSWSSVDSMIETESGYVSKEGMNWEDDFRRGFLKNAIQTAYAFADLATWPVGLGSGCGELTGDLIREQIAKSKFRLRQQYTPSTVNIEPGNPGESADFTATVDSSGYLSVSFSNRVSGSSGNYYKGWSPPVMRIAQESEAVSFAADYYFWWGRRLLARYYASSSIDDLVGALFLAKAALSEVVYCAHLIIHEMLHANALCGGSHCVGVDCGPLLSQRVFLERVLAKIGLPMPLAFSLSSSGGVDFYVRQPKAFDEAVYQRFAAKGYAGLYALSCSAPSGSGALLSVERDSVWAADGGGVARAVIPSAMGHATSRSGRT